MSTTLVKRLQPWRCEVTGCDSVNFFTQSKCRACNALCPLFMAQPDPRNWAVSDVLAIHGAFKNSVDLLHIAEKGIGGTLSMTGVLLSAVNAILYCERADYMFWDIGCGVGKVLLAAMVALNPRAITYIRPVMSICAPSVGLALLKLLQTRATGDAGGLVGGREQAPRQGSSIRISGLRESDFKTSLEMVADPTPQGAIYPLGDGWGLIRFKAGYKKVLLSTHPLVIKEVDGPILNLHAQPLIPYTCHVASSKQCEAIAESTGKRSKLRSGFLPPTNSFLLSPNECLTVDWVKPPTEQKVARPTPSLTASTTTMPASSSSSSSSAANPLTLSATSAPSSSVTDLARRMTDEEEEEWKDLPWNWQDTGRVRVVTIDDQIPEVSEIKRFVKVLAKGAEGLQVRGSLITKADGEVDELYCDLFTALEDCIITYATKHKNHFARGWSAEPKPNPESTTHPHTSTKTTELGPSPESDDLIDDPPAPGLVAGGVVHEVITTGIPNVTNVPPQSPGKVTSSSNSEGSGPGYENLPTLERPSTRPRASSEPNNRRKDEGESTLTDKMWDKEIIKYAYVEHMAAVPHALPTSAASPGERQFVPCLLFSSDKVPQGQEHLSLSSAWNPPPVLYQTGPSQFHGHGTAQPYASTRMTTLAAASFKLTAS
eukprot:g1642.t1